MYREYLCVDCCIVGCVAVWAEGCTTFRLNIFYLKVVVVDSSE